MCPQPPPVSMPLSIDVDSTDEELIFFLGKRRDGDPIPLNVITEINPFIIDPRNSPEGIWFLYTSKDSQSHNEGDIIRVTNGYWRSIDDHRILTGTCAVGRKTTRRFFVGEAPLGDSTAWRMQEYCAEQMAAQINSNKSQHNSSLCRFFLQNDERSDNGEQCGPVSSNSADGEYLESVLLSLIEQEERNLPLRDAANGSQEEVGEGEPRPLEPLIRPPSDASCANSMEGTQAGHDFSKEDFIELKDLYDPEPSSSGSDNSSVASMNSDECFDAEAMLRDIENEADPNMEEHVNYRLNVAPTVRSNHVAIRPPSPAFCESNNLVVRDNGSDNSISAPVLALAPSNAEPQSDSDASTSGSSQGRDCNASGSGSSQGNGSSKRPKSVRRMGKLGKRYCCFRSF